MEKPDFAFMGPPTAHVMGIPYVSITGMGVKPEGVDNGSHDTAAEAWTAFIIECAKHLDSGSQVAWRLFPEMNVDDGKYRVRARLAVT